MPDDGTAASASERRRIKVAVLIGSLEVGGAEQDIVRNVPLLDRDEFEVVVVLFQHPGPLAAELERRGIRVISRLGQPVPPVSGIRRAGRIFSALVWVGRTLRRESVDIVHCHLPHSYAYGIVTRALWRPRARVVMSRLSLNFYRNSHRAIAWLERHVLHGRVDIAIANSTVIVDELVAEGVAREKVRLVYNGIAPEPFTRDTSVRRATRAALGLPEDAFVMLAVGNLHTYKGHADLIEACALAPDRLPAGWALLIAGRDQEGNRATYENLIEERSLADHIRLLGPRDDVPALMAAADVFVQPSHHEGLPNAIIEAMAASLPVVATRVGGIPEAVYPAGDEGETGWLVPPHDSHALAEALVEAGADRARRSEMGVRARVRVESDFTVERSVREYERIYRELMH